MSADPLPSRHQLVYDAVLDISANTLGSIIGRAGRKFRTGEEVEEILRDLAKRGLVVAIGARAPILWRRR